MCSTIYFTFLTSSFFILSSHSLCQELSFALWQIDGEKLETVTDMIFLGSKITVDSDCSHEIKRYLEEKL